MCLSRQCDEVIAIDPAEMSAAALKANVTHLKAKAQDVLPQISEHGPADVLVCDINHHICDTLPAVVGLLPCVEKGGLVIVTLKFFGVGRDRTKWLHKLTEDLKTDLEVLHVLWLHANTVNERTLIARR